MMTSGDDEFGISVPKKTPSPPAAGPAAALYAELFEAIDSDGSGFLDEVEGKQFLRCSGCEEAELDYYWADLVRSADTDSDGRIEKEEFLTYTVGNEDLDASGGFVDAEQEAILRGELLALRSAAALEPAPGEAAPAAALHAQSGSELNLMVLRSEPDSLPSAASSAAVPGAAAAEPSQMLKWSDGRTVGGADIPEPEPAVRTIGRQRMLFSTC